MPFVQQLWRHRGQYLLFMNHRIPCGQIAHFGVFMNSLPVGADDGPAVRLTAFMILSDELTGDNGAGREAFQVPFPRSWNGLVEIVDTEDEAAFGGGKDTEVRDMH